MTSPVALVLQSTDLTSPPLVQLGTTLLAAVATVVRIHWPEPVDDVDDADDHARLLDAIARKSGAESLEALQAYLQGWYTITACEDAVVASDESIPTADDVARSRQPEATA